MNIHLLQNLLKILRLRYPSCLIYFYVGLLGLIRQTYILSMFTIQGASCQVPTLLLLQEVMLLRKRNIFRHLL
ncbi:hypothetical protein Hanom_Chr05g00442781 [Helianthus anomalus]